MPATTARKVRPDLATIITGADIAVKLPWRFSKRTVAYLNISGHSRQHLFRMMM
jgi:hypothetical protein